MRLPRGWDEPDMRLHVSAQLHAFKRSADLGQCTQLAGSFCTANRAWINWVRAALDGFAAADLRVSRLAGDPGTDGMMSMAGVIA
jgi:hypothetical protein